MNRAMRRSLRLDAQTFNRTLEATGIARSMHLDANETMSFARSLEAIDRKVYEKRYPALLGTKLVPIASGVPVGAAEYTYRYTDEIGQAEVSTNLPDDEPRIDVVGYEESSPIVQITAGYGYTLQDLERAQLTGIPLDEKRALSARKAIARKVNELLLLGHTATGVVGLYKSSAVQSVSATTGAWENASRTADQVLADLQKLEREVMEETLSVEAPDTLVLPPVLYAIASNIRLSNTETTALEFFLRKSRSVRFVEVDPLLATASSGSAERIVLYSRDPETVEGILPMEFSQLPPQPKSFSFSVPCRAVCGGAVIRYPGAMGYMDGCGGT